MLEDKKIDESWHVLEFNTPILEKIESTDGLMIKGSAITETTTHNGHKYIAEELQKAVASLNGRPLLVDHENKVENIKGVVNKAWWNEANKSIDFEAKVMDKNIKEMIKDGRVNKVSIGAYAEDLVKEEETNNYIAKGIRIAELSLVAVPADENANFAMAMTKSISLKESMDMAKCPECEKMIPKDQMKKHMSDKHSAPEESFKSEPESYSRNVRRLSEMTEEKALQESENVKLREEITQLKNERKQSMISEYKRICAEKKVNAKDVSSMSEETIKALTEQVSEIKVFEEKKEMKSEIKTVAEFPKEMDNFVVERSQYVKGSAFWVMPDEKGKISVKRW